MSYKIYEEYVDSEIDWIGSIPSTWRILKSKYIFNRVNIPSTSGNEELLSVSEYYGVKPKKETIGEGEFLSRAESLIGYKKCSKNDLVMNIMLAWKKGLGVTEYDGIVSPAYEIFNINTQITYPRYINYLFRTDLYASEFKRHSYGVIDSRLRLYPDNFKEIECILPSIEEQHYIADYLDKQTTKIDDTIAKNEELMQLLEEKRVALINKVVTKGLNPDVPMKESGIEWIGEIPKDWELFKIKYLIDYYSGGAWGTDKKEDSQDIICIRVADFDYPNGSIKDMDYTIRNIVLNNRLLLESGDLLIEKSGGGENQPVGRVIYFDKDFKATCSNFISKIKINNSYDSKFVYYLFNILYSSGVNKKSIKQTTGIQNLDQNSYFDEIVAIPSLIEQKQIVTYLDRETSKIKNILNKIRENIVFLEEYKNSLIYHVVTGKIDVRGENI